MTIAGSREFSPAACVRVTCGEFGLRTARRHPAEARSTRKVEGASLFRRSIGRVYVVLPSFVMVDRRVEAHDLIEAGRFSEALNVLRKKAGLSRREARDAVETPRSGGVLAEWPVPDMPDLSARVADLKAVGRRKEALFLVRIEQQVSQAEAERFVDSV